MDDTILMFNDILERVYEIYQGDEHFHNCVSEAIKTAYCESLPKDVMGKPMIKYKSVIQEDIEQLNYYYTLKIKINEYNLGLSIKFETRDAAIQYGIEDKRKLASYKTLEKALITIDKYYEFFLANGLFIDIPHPQLSYAYYNCFFRKKLPLQARARYAELRDAEHNPANRNAKLAAYNTLLNIAKLRNDEDVAAMYEDLVSKQELIGYENNHYGPIYNYLAELDINVLNRFMMLNEKNYARDDELVFMGLPIPREKAELVRLKAKKG